MDSSVVKIAGIRYIVEQIADMTNRHGAMGQINYNEQTILVDRHLPVDRKNEVFVHEILHGCFREAGFEEQDEDMINRVAKVLHQVLKDNPNLMLML